MAANSPSRVFCRPWIIKTPDPDKSRYLRRYFRVYKEWKARLTAAPAARIRKQLDRVYKRVAYIFIDELWRLHFILFVQSSLTCNRSLGFHTSSVPQFDCQKVQDLPHFDKICCTQDLEFNKPVAASRSAFPGKNITGM
jgi:hypothetical protein